MSYRLFCGCLLSKSRVGARATAKGRKVSSVCGQHRGLPSLVCRPLAPSANGISLAGTVQISKWDTVLRSPERHRRLAGRIEVWPVQTTLRSRERKVWGNGKLAPGKPRWLPRVCISTCVPFLDETAGTDRGEKGSSKSFGQRGHEGEADRPRHRQNLYCA